MSQKISNRFCISCFPPNPVDPINLNITTPKEFKAKLDSVQQDASQVKLVPRTKNVLIPDYVKEINPNVKLNPQGKLGLGTEDNPFWLPEYNFIKKPWYINAADSLSNGFGNVVNTVMLNEGNKRVENAKKSDQTWAYKVHPRQYAAGLSAMGSFVPGPAGVILQTPQAGFSFLDLLQDPSFDNTVEAGIQLGSMAMPTGRILRKSNINLNVPTPFRATRTLPSGTTVTRRLTYPVNVTIPAKLGVGGLEILNTTGDINQVITGEQTMEMLRGTPHEQQFHDDIVIEDKGNGTEMYDPYLRNGKTNKKTN